MSTERFYAEIKAFSDFQTLGDDAHYKALPNDWSVVITDVRGSTKAIEQGRYQDVNTLGAASVAILEQLWQDDSVPFVFGGDGASLLVPPSQVALVSKTLLRLRNLARANYDLELRVGLVSMKEISEKGLTIEVAKFGAPGTKAIAFIRGGGLSWADSKIKSEPDRYCLTDTGAGVLEELKGLSCRWEPLKTRKGLIVSILARSATNDVKIFPEILGTLSKYLGGDVQASSPATAETFVSKSYWDAFKSEYHYHSRHFHKSYVTRLLMTAFSVWSLKSERESPFNAKKYKASMPSHSDFRKFDDMLRLVLDCTPEQVTNIRTYLESLHRAGQIYFGIHESDHAIMTCLVGSTNDGDHIHFIDGGAGGYAVAAKSLKEQMAGLHSPGAAV